MVIDFMSYVFSVFSAGAGFGVGSGAGAGAGSVDPSVDVVDEFEELWELSDEELCELSDDDYSVLV